MLKRKTRALYHKIIYNSGVMWLIPDLWRWTQCPFMIGIFKMVTDI